MSQQTGFDKLFADLIGGLREYYLVLKNPVLVEVIRASAKPLHKETGNNQADYESLRDLVESSLKSRAYNIALFFQMIDAASAVSVDDGCLLTDWETYGPTGDPDNEIARFSWTDGESDFSDVFTERGVADGEFSEDGRFVLENAEGDTSVIRFYSTEKLTSPAGTKAAVALAATQAALSQAMQHHQDLARMLQRLNEKVRRANDIQHSGGKLQAEDWGELFQLSNEASALLQWK